MSNVCPPSGTFVEHDSIELSAIEAAFAEYIYEQWGALTPSHSYHLSTKGKDKEGRKLMFCSLKDADRQYEFGGVARDATASLLADFTRRFQDSLKPSVGSSHALHHLCLEILEWGGVEGASSQWLRERCDEGVLARAICAAVDELAGPLSPRHRGVSSVFANGTPMNSGMTKILALAAPDQIIIYDGRVGAALGLLARRFLERGQRWCAPGASSSRADEVPELLRWGWGDGQVTAKQRGRRDPSTPSFKFPALRSGTHPDLRHAEYVWRASRVLKKARSLISKSEGVTLHDLERALFMIGYDVRGLSAQFGPYNPILSATDSSSRS